MSDSNTEQKLALLSEFRQKLLAIALCNIEMISIYAELESLGLDATDKMALTAGAGMAAHGSHMTVVAVRELEAKLGKQYDTTEETNTSTEEVESEEVKASDVPGEKGSADVLDFMARLNKGGATKH